MTNCRSILVVVGHREGASALLEKAVAIARQWQARIELFLCDSEAAFELGHAYCREDIDAACQEIIERARTYLLDLRAGARAHGVVIEVEAVCDSPLYEAIVRKVLRSEPELVIKGLPAGIGARDPNDWQLIRACPTTLMLSGHKVWRRPPRLAAAVDVSEQESQGMPEAVLQAAQLLGSTWKADVDVVYAERPETSLKSCAGRLRALCESNGIAPDRMHLLQGIPEACLPLFAARQKYDIVVLGALAHHTDRAQVGALTSRLLDTADCDFVLVKPPGYCSPLDEQLGGTRHESCPRIGPAPAARRNR